MGIMELVVLVILFGGPLFLIALIDLLRSEFKGSDKIVWLLVVILLPILGSVCYLLIGSKQKLAKPPAGTDAP